MKIKYIIITRFNLDYKKIVKEKLRADPEVWLENRIKLFFDYCYPSMLNQSDKDFEWWVFFDLQTSDDIIDIIRERDKAGLIKFKFSSWAEFREDILTELNSIPESYDYLLNARIDSDDGLSKFNIEEIKKAVYCLLNSQLSPFILNPLSGLFFDTSNTILYKKKLYNNPFQVLVQKYGEIEQSVFTFQHQTASDNFNVINVSNIPYWLVVVHGSNWLNVKSGRPIIFKEKVFRKYFSVLMLSESQITTYGFIKEYLNYIQKMMVKARSKLISIKNKILS